MNALEGFSRNFFYAFVVKAVFALIFGLKGHITGGKRGLVQAFIDLFSSESMSFCTFLGSFFGIYKASICTLRRWRGVDDELGAFISGGLAGLALFFDQSFHRRKFIVLYLFCRALDMLVQILDKKKYIKKIPYFEVYMFSPVIGMLFYSYMFETECFPPGIDKAFKYCSYPKQIEYDMFENVWQRMGRVLFPGKATKLKLV